MNKIEQDISKLLSSFRNNSEIKECFYHKKDECKGAIKNAHSISRGNRLELIKGLVNNNDIVYSLSEIKIENSKAKQGIKQIGWGKAASTFYGFCDWHDTELFKPIENNNDFDNSPEHCFLHSYRSFAYSYHQIKKTYKLGENAISDISKQVEELQLNVISDKLNDISLKMNNSEPFKEIISELGKIIPDLTHQLKSELSDSKEKLSYSQKELDSKHLHSNLHWMSKYKEKLDYAIEKKSYEKLKYYCKTKNGLFPFTCAFAFSPDFIYSEMENHIISSSNQKELINACLMLTILPDKSNKTIILFSCFEGDKQSEYFLNKLFSLQNEIEFEKAVTSIIINKASNVYLNPTMWDKLGVQQQILEDEINSERPFDELPKKPFMSKVNFFSGEFSADNLGISIND